MGSVWPPDVGLKIIVPTYHGTHFIVGAYDKGRFGLQKNMQAVLIFATKQNLREQSIAV